MKRLLLVLFAAVGLSGCIIHPIRPPLAPRPPHHGHRHHHHHHAIHVNVR